jgi:hypothetical protein
MYGTTGGLLMYIYSYVEVGQRVKVGDFLLPLTIWICIRIRKCSSRPRCVGMKGL